jgi:ribosomal protein S18 acetylase RimI-like enzyme
MNAPKKNEEIRIRAPRITDAANLARLSTQLGYPATPEQVVSRLQGILSDPNAELFVAERASGGVAGFIHLMHQHLIEYDPRAELVALVVDEDCRGQGVGRADGPRRRMGPRSRLQVRPSSFKDVPRCRARFL